MRSLPGGMRQCQHVCRPSKGEETQVCDLRFVLRNPTANAFSGVKCMCLPPRGEYYIVFLHLSLASYFAFEQGHNTQAGAGVTHGNEGLTGRIPGSPYLGKHICARILYGYNGGLGRLGCDIARSEWEACALPGRTSGPPLPTSWQFQSIAPRQRPGNDAAGFGKATESCYGVDGGSDQTGDISPKA